MNCELAVAELVECARHHLLPEGEVRVHLDSCQPCIERWDAERHLTGHLRVMRIAATPDGFEWSKAVLMREFEANLKRERKVRWVRGATWAMSTAAALVISVVAVQDVWRPAIVRSVTETTAEPQSYAVRDYGQESFAPAVEAGEQGFVAVPFATPTLPEERLTMVRTELGPAALASMGFRVDPGLTGALPADLLLGQDGFPRAVRVSNDDDFAEKGF